MGFHEFFQTSFSKLTWFPFLVMTCTLYSKFVKLLQPVNFTNFMNLIFGGFFAIWPKHQATLPRPRSTPCRRGGLSWCACASFSPTKSPSVPTCFCPSPLPTLGAPTRHRSNTVHRKQCSLHIYFSIWMIRNQNLKKYLPLHTIWL